MYEGNNSLYLQSQTLELAIKVWHVTPATPSQALCLVKLIDRNPVRVKSPVRTKPFRAGMIHTFLQISRKATAHSLSLLPLDTEKGFKCNFKTTYWTLIGIKTRDCKQLYKVNFNNKGTSNMDGFPDTDIITCSGPFFTGSGRRKSIGPFLTKQ